MLNLSVAGEENTSLTSRSDGDDAGVDDKHEVNLKL